MPAFNVNHEIFLPGLPVLSPGSPVARRSAEIPDVQQTGVPLKTRFMRIEYMDSRMAGGKGKKGTISDSTQRIDALMIFTGWSGRSLRSVFTLPIRSTTSIPSTTLPNTG